MRMKFSKIHHYILPTLKNGCIGVIPTDTIYGIVGLASSKKTVEKIYRLRRRNPKKPMIILVGSTGDLKSFGIVTTPAIKKILNKVWPGKVSVVLPIKAGRYAKKFAYLHRRTKTLAFRLPEVPWLQSFLKKTGPLVAPSANFEGKTPARTVTEAKKYFGDKIDFYINVGRLTSKPSTLVKITNGKIEILRKGAVKIL
jgi:L-threonylcarbamoyladenylate synthase